LVFLLNKLDSFNKLQGFGTIRVFTHQSPFLKTITNTQEIQIQVSGGEQGIFNTSISQHLNIFHLSSQLLRKECPALHHQHSRHLPQQSQKHSKQITALKRESSPPLFLLGTTPAKFSTTSLHQLFSSSLHKTTHHSFSALLSPPFFRFARGTFSREGKLFDLLAFRLEGHCTRSLFSVFFSGFGFGISQRLSSQCNFFGKLGKSSRHRTLRWKTAHETFCFTHP
jgi:hypothetical protein